MPTLTLLNLLAAELPGRAPTSLVFCQEGALGYFSKQGVDEHANKVKGAWLVGV
jgi:hypothetical protein